MPESLEQTLAKLLAEEQSAIDKLAASLNAEAAALKDRDLNAIERTAKEKQQHLNTFNLKVKARLHYLATKFEQPNQDDFEKLLASLPHPARKNLSTQWQSLKGDFKDVIWQNEKNGQLIYHSRLRNRTLLNILQGPENQPDLYNETGASKGSVGRHRLGKA